MMLAFLFAAALQVTVQDPVQVEAVLSRDRIAIGEAATLTITVITRGLAPESIRNPVLPADLDIVGTSDFTETRIGVPGGRVRVLRREIVMLPRTTGAFRIPGAVVVVDGTSYRTPQLLLRVAGPVFSPGAADGEERSGTSLVVRLFPDTVFVGQQVVLQAEVTFAEQMRTRQSRPPAFEPPAPSGFWVQDLPDPVTISLRVRDGRTVESQTFRRAYFPLDAGEFAFPPAHLHYEVRRGFLSPPESRRVTSDSARLVVLPLPEEGQPRPFTGAVGRLAMSASVAPQRVAVGEAAILTLELAGRGNVRALAQPRLPELRGVEVFPPTQEAHVDVEGDVVGGSKSFRWILVPEVPGRLVVPPIEYSVFDPDLRQYVTMHTDSLRLEVAPVVAATEQDTALRPLRTVTGRPAAAWAETPLFAALQAVPLLLVGAGMLVRRRRARPPGPRQHERRIRGELAALRGRDDADVPAALERLLGDAVRTVAGLDGADPAAALRAAGRTVEADELTVLVADLRRLRYAPAGERGSLEPVFARVDAFIAGLAPARRRRSPAAGGAVAVALVWLTAGSGGHADEAAFQSGVAAFAAGDHVTAANRFHSYVRAAPDDANGWYNLGLASYQAGDRGRAVWAWLRGARTAPRDADLLHNLRLTADAAAIAAVLPVDRLARGERLLILAVAWWVLVLAVGARIRRPHAAASVLAGLAAVVMVAALTALVAVAVRQTLVTPLRDGAPLFAGPTVREQAVARLEAGQVARLLERREGWLLVRMGTGRDAWVERDNVAGL
jgi:hypothetical protein